MIWSQRRAFETLFVLFGTNRPFRQNVPYMWSKTEVLTKQWASTPGNAL